MPEREATPALQTAEESQNRTEVFAVHGADPEVLAYAMAKYSRSALSMRESLREISSQRAEQFLNTFYFQYGHRSIADLAHLAFAIERLSLLAAIVLVDEQRWDGQERSTRYQNFRKSGWYMPDFSGDMGAAGSFREGVEALFAAYHEVAGGVLESLKRKVPRPEEMKPETWERTLKARAFDVARYLLPLATNTSLGQIVNARTLEAQISRLLSSPFAEIRQLGETLREAASGAAWNVHGEELAKLAQEIAALDPALGQRASALLTREVKTAPTLVKYAAPNEYEMATLRELRQATDELMKGEPMDNAPAVDLIGGDETLEVELATTLLYGACHYPYRQIRRVVDDLSEASRNEIISLGARHRGKHDELLREFSAGQALRFDILMDIGGFRDMHRHRKCVQVLQGFTSLHGYEIPEGLEEAGLVARYRQAIDAAHAAYEQLETRHPESAQYALPLGTRIRALFKMDFAEAVYISELRSAPQGHFSYRRIAWEMYEAVRQQHPALAEYFRMTDVREPIDLLKR
ncbi:MAG TPA: FAD-dependent thymidylate synthase [Acidobacteriaceae bacterium]|nr:FAD-dependent thymidylate synthase [Acidobacteriaceae bacterium]